MAEAPAPPKDVVELLEKVAREMRADPTFLAAEAEAAQRGGLTVLADASGHAPSLAGVDLQDEGDAITVTAETRNAQPGHVHVTLADLVLSIGLGEGKDAYRHDLVLPAPVDEERAVATFRNGVLDIVLPRRR